MKEICDNEQCTGCGLCSIKCPKQCISIVENNEGFRYPHISSELCVDCGMCRRVCPSINNVEKNSVTNVYAAWAKDDTVRMTSSSGGIFGVIATYIINQGGIVAGVSLDFEKLVLRHICVDNIDDLEKLKKSKYFQSDCLDVFSEIKQRLNVGQYVLFTGTACQVVALKQYLSGINTDKLYTVDVLCHGVTSRKVVHSYIEDLEKTYGDTAIEIQFRNKEKNGGWVIMKVEFKNKSPYIAQSRDDAFMNAFNNNLSLRMSCYNCHYSGKDRVSDITIADFWGMDDPDIVREAQGKGISAVFVNTGKGVELFEKIRKDCIVYERSYDEAARNNHVLTAPMPYNPKRKYFFEKLGKVTFQKLVLRSTRTVRIKKSINLFFNRCLRKLYKIKRGALHE